MLSRLRRNTHACTKEAWYASAAEFRSAITASSPSSSRRMLQAEGDTFRFTATPTGGDCGFHTIAWALNAHQTGMPTNLLTAIDIRRKLSIHIRQDADFYTERLQTIGIASSNEEAQRSITRITDSVLQPGVHGHWLGQVWGDVELLAIARLFRCRLQLFTFDVTMQAVRRYASFNEGKRTICVFFSGRANAGHFDMLLMYNPWWRRFM